MSIHFLIVPQGIHINLSGQAMHSFIVDLDDIYYYSAQRGSKGELHMSLTTEVPERIQSLLAKRQEHLDAVAAIDATLEKVAGVLTPNGRGPKPAVAPAKAPAAAGKKRQKPREFAVSASESILAFVKANKNPTTQDVKKHWDSEGRGGRADQTLSVLTKAKKLKRTPLGKGQLGSTYSLA
jgi:hypothetical protein